MVPPLLVTDMIPRRGAGRNFDEARARHSGLVDLVGLEGPAIVVERVPITQRKTDRV
jgi:hypothetical protein